MPNSSYTGTMAPAGFSTSTNRITDAGYGYDALGNLNQMPALGTAKYDAENRLVAVCTNDTTATCTNQAAAGRTIYQYDGDGRRVMKQLPDGTTTYYVYDASGQLAVELGGPAFAPGTRYFTVDQLGSTRAVTDATGNVLARHDYRPFGDEIAGIRPVGIGYGGDPGETMLFTGKERDAETGLDFFESRHFSSAQGRFTSPDSMIMKKEWFADPQRWNHYAYVRNNPLRYVDPNGEDLTIVYSYGPDASDEQKKWFEANKAQIFAAIQKKSMTLV
ncbi:MAG TPA: RHS repeat-associated core domain-containing protein [Bryobacteraceae bacterium]|nr:RHS repeat-associated core domain-containing protein [Bryobacteraceae bacterium]